MKNTKVGLVILGAVAALGMATVASAADPQAGQPTDKQYGQPAPTAAKGQPFHGKVEAVDTSAKTLTVGGTLIQVADTTKLTKSGKAIMLTDIKEGDQVNGSTRQTTDGKAEAVNVDVGGAGKEKLPEPN